MNIKDVLDNIDKLLASMKVSSLSCTLKHRDVKMYDFILEQTSFLDKYETDNAHVSLLERIYCLRNNLTDRPLCKKCGLNHVTGFNSALQEYKKWCSPKCQASDKECIAKSKATRKKRYGDENFSNIQKAAKTRHEKNNGKWNGADFASKVKQTKLRRYGSETFTNVEKTKQTKLERYGDANWNNYKKCKQTKLERYGNATWNNRKQFKATIQQFDEDKQQRIIAKRKVTNLEKYGAEFATQSIDVKDKIKRTCNKKYSCDSVLQSRSVRTASAKAIKLKSWNMIIAEKDYTPLFSQEDYIRNSAVYGYMFQWKCNKCGTIFSSAYDNGHHHRCYACYPNTTNGTSLLEQEIAAYVRSITSCTVLNHDKMTRSIIPPKEIDIYVPALKLGIEVDGLFYHTEEAGKDRNYHLDKTLECKKKGIRLIHIFEDEWLEKKQIVMSRLKHIVGKKQRKIMARKCIVREIDDMTKNMFLDKYHLQGRDTSSIRYGLFYHQHLIAVMTFVRSRFNKNYEWELSRYATVSNFIVMGGAGKLLSCFEKQYAPKSLVTYADCRWSVGDLYAKLGFNLLHHSAPNYFYVKNQIRYSRIKFQKHRQKTILNVFDEKLSEVENMRANGYQRIFDCGNLVFVKNY